MESKSPSWDRTARVVLPALSLIAFIVARVMGKYSRLSWILFGLAVFFVVSGYHSELREAHLRWKAGRDDRLVVEEAFPVFREFVRRSELFVDNTTNDNLHYIVHTELHQNLPSTQLIQFPQMDLWSCFWLYLSQRLDRQPPRMSEFRPALMEFHFWFQRTVLIVSRRFFSTRRRIFTQKSSLRQRASSIYFNTVSPHS